MKPKFINPLVLAYLGDSVLELAIREYLIKEGNFGKPKELQQEALKFVSAKAHTDFIYYAMEKGLLTEDEMNLYKRGRNTKGNKNESLEHHHSTGLEAIFGYYYLVGNQKRIAGLVAEMIAYLK